MPETLQETEAEVRELAVSTLTDWFAAVVVPRYMAQTSDGVKLGPSYWAELCGMTPKVVAKRVERARSKAVSKATISVPTETHKGSIRAARSAITAHPELAADLLRNPDVAKVITDAVLTNAGQTRNRAPISDQRRDLDAYDYLLKLRVACGNLQRNLPDYVPNDDISEEAAETVQHLRATVRFIERWVDGQDIVADVEAYLKKMSA